MSILSQISLIAAANSSWVGNTDSLSGRTELLIESDIYRCFNADFCIFAMASPDKTPWVTIASTLFAPFLSRSSVL